ncbi:MAG: hypothetical protein IJ789_02590 [Bacteroidales bacterium]|nr:hypothetical protein [Bacteroidales bacterium]
MKKKSLKIVCALFISVLATTFFGACDHDTNCYVEVTTIDMETGKPLSGTFVYLEQEGRTYATERTNKSGVCTISLTAPALMNVVAKYEYVADGLPTNKFFYHKGETAVRLADGETKEVVIRIDRSGEPLSEMRN